MFNPVEQGIDIVSVNKIEIMGIKIRSEIGKVIVWNNNIFKKMLSNPIKNAVTIDRVKVASIFSNKALPLNSPTIKSREVLAINGLLIFPLNDNNAGMIRIKTKKLLNGSIKRESRIPARTPPIIEMISEGKVSLTMVALPLEFCFAMVHYQLNPRDKYFDVLTLLLIFLILEPINNFIIKKKMLSSLKNCIILIIRVFFF